MLVGLVLLPAVRTLRARQAPPALDTLSGGAAVLTNATLVIGAGAPRDANGVSHSFWSQKPSDPPTYTAAVGSTLVFRYSRRTSP